MARLGNGISILGSACAIVFAFGCADSAEPSQIAVEQGSHGGTQIHTEDDCDPVTFGALCKPGFNGHTTLSDFLAEFGATNEVAAWEYGGGQIQVTQGHSFRVDNQGGETHTFSVVANFGGGRVPPLNTGNPTVAPECVGAAGPNNVDIAAGTGITVTTGAGGQLAAKGTYKVQCCIHPWMRTTVVIK